jgi:DHA2 family methylenomycin A resistance protein-like MFS transporter
METSHGSDSRVRRSIALSAMCTGMFFILLDVTIVNVALPAIRSGLHTSASGELWVIDADTLVFACLMLTGGALGDRLGRRRFALLGLGVFAIGSLACALAPSTAVLIAARAVQGVGGALLVPQTLAIIAMLYPNRQEQARVLGIWAGVSSLALPAGPLLGALLVSGFGWRAIFAVNVPICIAAALVTAFVIERDPPQHDRALDLPGQVLVTVALAGITWCCIESTSASLPTIVIVATVTAIALVTFIVVQSRAREPMLPRGLLSDSTFVGANTVGFLMNFAGTAVILLITLLIQVARGTPTLTTAFWLLPLTAPLAVFPPGAARIAARFGYRTPMVIGMTTASIGMLGLLSVGAHNGMAGVTISGVLIGVGLALNTAPMVAAVMAAVADEDRALAGAMNNAARQVGAAIGVAALGSIAGDPSHSAFFGGLHRAAILGAAAWLVAAAIAARHVRGHPRAPAKTSDDGHRVFTRRPATVSAPAR